VPRIVLVDTFKDEAGGAPGRPCARRPAVRDRLDTPSERVGSPADLVKEIRARLDQEGYGHVKIVGPAV